ncbi:2,4-dihydroxyhept-2-ene-1,7-dioic acid aldolase [Xanthomonas translucens pv. undulosa]|nr:2,4-dihydroxyhept-2-ene-1,7-dioic acid aldolase [Xanthomonas translucens pv. undulosa]AVY65932.1 2,4-dihydroxyhept-2-ene-1,7-dioic acid aldolase [Xanthomonas translucens pv. undulosa]
MRQSAAAVRALPQILEPYGVSLVMEGALNLNVGPQGWTQVLAITAARATASMPCCPNPRDPARRQCWLAQPNLQRLFASEDRALLQAALGQPATDLRPR